MELGKNIISNSKIDTNGGDFINGNNNFIQKIIINTIDIKAKLGSIVKQTKNVLNKIQSDISGVKLKRNLTDLPIKEIISNNQFIFIDGVAGSGKSVYAKQILESLDDTCIISFAADQFLKSSLINTLHEINVDLSIDEIFNEFEEFSNKLIYIDSFEKLLEGDAESFRELIAVLNENKNIKLIVSSRSYALETLKFNYFNKDLLLYNSFSVKVPELNDNELKHFAEKIPTLQNIIQNENLSEIIRIPKYLSLAEKLVSVSDEDLSIIDVVEFKKQLWKNVVGGNIGVSQEKRQNTFVGIAVKRAKNLTLLTATSEFDSEVVYRLKADGVLYEENNLYAPSHDIFEDWALIKYVDYLKINNPKIDLFYNSLTNEPAIRRGFRLWIESKIEESDSWIYNFIIDTINSTLIENHWKDEVLISIIKSNLCDKFFKEHKEELLVDSLKLLKRIIHLLKISGKDFNQSPNNQGWDVVIKFLFDNLDELTEIYTLILRFLYDWENILFYGRITNVSTPKYVGKLVTKILNNFEESVDWMNAGESNSLTEKGIKLQYQLAEYIPDEIKGLLDNLLIETQEEDYKLINKKDKQIEYALSHFHSGALTKIFPDELIALANLKWKYKKIESKSRFGFEHSPYGIEHHFGITDKHDFKYFPHSTYQTFVYKLLKSTPLKALDFIIEFTNYCTNNYIKSDFLKNDGFGINKDDITSIDLLYNGQIYPMHGSNYLWLINRGGQITVPDLLQSIVVALEKYLYELGLIESEKVDKIIQSFFDIIYTKSDSVILISVLSSISMAYPKKVGNKILPLVSDQNFFFWDGYRWLSDQKDYALGGIFDTYSKICTQERQDALKWKHRKKYYRGLINFLIEYQILYGNFNGELFKMFDYMENKHGKDDVYFLKLLSEIDGRKQKVEKIEHEGKMVIQVSPDYSVNSSLEKEMRKNKEKNDFQNEYSKYSLWISQTFQKKSEENLTYEYWKECFEYSQSYDNSKVDFINPFPIGTLASLGLDLFSEDLTKNEFEFCANTILEIAQKLFEQKKKERFDINNSDLSISIFDNDSVYGSLPKLLLFKEKLEKEQLNDIKALIFFFLRDLNKKLDIHLENFYNSFKKDVWSADYQFAYNCFIGIILYAEFFKKYPRHNRYSDEEMKTIQNEEMKILNFIESNENIYELTNLSYSKYSHWELEKVMQIFPIHNEYGFTYNFLELMFNAQIESYSLEKDTFSPTIYHEIGVAIRDVIIEFILEIPFNTNTKSFFEFIIRSGINFNLETRRSYNAIKYITEYTEWLYYKVDSNSNSEKMLSNFWEFWNVLYLNIKDNTRLFNKEYLFYGNYWKYEADDWFVLKNENVSSFFLKRVNSLDYLDVEALIQLLSGIGFKSLMPQGIKTLTKHLKSDIKQLRSINYYYGEKLIMRCFKDKMKIIKEDESLLNEFLWFLNIMINLGSSKAYYIRENLILYKKS